LEEAAYFSRQRVVVSSSNAVSGRMVDQSLGGDY
jgi:hypothetical protein